MIWGKSDIFYVGELYRDTNFINQDKESCKEEIHSDSVIVNLIPFKKEILEVTFQEKNIDDSKQTE